MIHYYKIIELLIFLLTYLTKEVLYKINNQLISYNDIIISYDYYYILSANDDKL